LSSADWPSSDWLPPDCFPAPFIPPDCFPSDCFPSEDFPPDCLPSPCFPSEGFPPDCFPSDCFPSGDFPPDSSPLDSSPPDGLLSAELPSGDFPSADFPSGEFPFDDLESFDLSPDSDLPAALSGEPPPSFGDLVFSGSLAFLGLDCGGFSLAGFSLAGCFFSDLSLSDSFLSEPVLGFGFGVGCSALGWGFAAFGCVAELEAFSAGRISMISSRERLSPSDRPEGGFAALVLGAASSRVAGSAGSGRLSRATAASRSWSPARRPCSFGTRFHGRWTGPATPRVSANSVCWKDAWGRWQRASMASLASPKSGSTARISSGSWPSSGTWTRGSFGARISTSGGTSGSTSIWCRIGVEERLPEGVSNRTR